MKCASRWCRKSNGIVYGTYIFNSSMHTLYCIHTVDSTPDSGVRSTRTKTNTKTKTTCQESPWRWQTCATSVGSGWSTCRLYFYCGVCKQEHFKNKTWNRSLSIQLLSRTASIQQNVLDVNASSLEYFCEVIEWNSNRIQRLQDCWRSCQIGYRQGCLETMDCSRGGEGCDASPCCCRPKGCHQRNIAMPDARLWSLVWCAVPKQKQNVQLALLKIACALRCRHLVPLRRHYQKTVPMVRDLWWNSRNIMSLVHSRRRTRNGFSWLRSRLELSETGTIPTTSIPPSIQHVCRDTLTIM